MLRFQETRPGESWRYYTYGKSIHNSECSHFHVSDVRRAGVVRQPSKDGWIGRNQEITKRCAKPSSCDFRYIAGYH